MIFIIRLFGQGVISSATKCHDELEHIKDIKMKDFSNIEDTLDLSGFPRRIEAIEEEVISSGYFNDKELRNDAMLKDLKSQVRIFLLKLSCYVFKKQ